MISVYSNAKINIGLNILKKISNGYHELDMVMVPISLSDRLDIEFQKKKGTLEIICDNDSIPVDENNIIYKVYKIFYKRTKLSEESIKVYLYKKIPSQAGLGGGSSNGAFFLNELNKYYGEVLSDEELIKLVKNVGADIPFFIKNLPCRVKGVGEELIEIRNNLQSKILLVKPNFGISTKEAYLLADKLEQKEYADIEQIIYSLKNNQLETTKKSIKNGLEQGLLFYSEKIINFRKKLDKLKNYSFFMSGSGSCYFSLLSKDERVCIKKLKEEIGNCEIYISNFL